MKDFGSAAWFGFVVGLIWGVGCALSLLYSIFLAGYRKAVEDSLRLEKTKRFKDALAKLQSRNNNSSGR